MLDSLCYNKYSKSDIQKINKYIKIFYANLIKSSEYVNKLNIDFKLDTISHKFNFDSKYIPKNIINYINSKPKQLFSFKTIINDKKITLSFYTMQNSNYNKTNLSQYATIVFTTIYLLSLYSSKKCSKNLHIQIFLTPFKKKLPVKLTEIIGVNNVNTGVTNIGCHDDGKIIVYREEEWFKVLIHELFHRLSLDFSTMNIDKESKILLNEFGYKSTYIIYETYTETWARIFNVIITSFYITENREKFIHIFYILINIERNFALIQSNLILKRFKTIADYKEDSNVFCYYILTAALMNDYLKFILWCADNNNNLIKFKTTDINLRSFTKLLIQQFNSENFKKNLICINKLPNKNGDSLRMTIVE
jgi:hypothetical protein